MGVGDSPGTQTNSRISSTTSVGTSYSAALTSGLSLSSPSAVVTSTVSIQGLYGNQDKIPGTLQSLKPLPKGADFEIFDTWRRGSIDRMGNSAGMVYVVLYSWLVSKEMALKAEPKGSTRTPEMIDQLWRSLHFKACCVLKEALRDALGDS